MAPERAGADRDRGRWRLLRPTTYVLVLISFALPFLTVSCSTPGGYGQVAQGGTTSYSGYVLAFGLVPHRTQGLLPPEQWRSDVLSWQPLLVLALLVLLAGLVVPLLLRRGFDRERVSAGAALLALLAVIGGALIGQGALASRIRANAVSRRQPLEQAPIDYVANGQGLVLVIVLLLIVLVGELGLIRSRYARARAPVPRVPRSPGGTQRGTQGETLPRSPSTPELPPRGRTIGGPWDAGPGGTDPGRAGTLPEPVVISSPATPRELD